MFSGLEKMGIPYMIVENDETIESCVKKIIEKLIH
jgi:hypothetical protein